jgi:molecular chaperone DnaK
MNQGRRATDRKAVGLLVKLKHGSVGSFIEEFATNLSPGGMFIRSRQPQPVGTPVKFEVQIANGQRMLRGSGVVRWIRTPEDTSGPPGMGVQFSELEPASQSLIDVMLQLNKARGVEGPGVATPATPAAPPAGGRRPTPAKDFPPPPVNDVDLPLSELVARTPPPAPGGDESLAPPLVDLSDPFANAPRETPEEESDEVTTPVPVERLEELARLEAAAAAKAAKAAGGGQEFELNLDAELPPPGERTGRQAVKSGSMQEFELDLESELPSPGERTGKQAVKAKGGVEEFDLDLGEVDGPAPSAPPEAAKGGVQEFDLEALDELIAAEIHAAEEKKKASAPVVPAAPLKPAVVRAPTVAPAVAPAIARGPAARAVAPVVPPAAPTVAAAAPSVRPVAPAVAPVAPPVAPASPVASPAAPRPPPRAPAAAAKATPAPMVTPVLAPAALAAPAPAAAPVADGRMRTVFLKPPESIAGTGPVIGIDLGTTNSCVAVLSGGRPQVLRSKEGYNTIPSVVSLTAQSKLLVSHRAKNQLVMRPQQTIYGAKRLVGRPFDSVVVRQVRERFHYEIIPDESGRAAVRLGEHVLSLEEVQGLILRECKEMAEAHLNQKVERAVITVPAYYSEQQREAVRKAGLMAGLKVERILNEPTSAALAYGLNRELSKKVLVYDLGGGTFDATVLRVEKNVFEVLGTGGDVFLGGLDFDNVIVDLLLERFQQQEKVAFSGDNVALSRVSDAAERAKVALSERTSHEVHIPMLMMDSAGKPRDLRVTLTRAEVDQACMPLVTRTLDVVRDVLLDAKLKASDVDDIILVGGQSRMPIVREKLKELFGKSPQASVNADEAVALGAALYSGAVDKVSSVVLIDVLPMTIGIAMPGGAFKRVVERNTALPVQRSFALTTTRDNEEVMELSVFQGEDNHISANEYLGTVRVEGLPKGPKGSVRVAVTLKLDSECVLHVTASEYSTRKEVKATLATRYTPEELQKKLGVTKEAARAAEERRGEDLKQRSGRFWGFLKKMVGRA